MINSKLYPTLSLFTAVLLGGMIATVSAQTSSSSAARAAGQDKVVLKVGNVQVRQSEMDDLINSFSAQQKQALSEQGRKALGEQYANMLLLSQVARSHRLDASPEFRRKIELDRDQLLANMEVQRIAAQTVISPAEVSQFYSAHHQDFQRVQVCQVAVVKKTGASGVGLPPAEAQAKAATIHKALASGEDINKVAQKFAVPNEVYVVTNPRTLSPTDPSVPAELRTAFQLKVGALSEPHDMRNYIEFFQVVGRPVISLKNATPLIEEGLRRQKVVAAVNNLKKQTPVWMDPSYFTSSPSAGGKKASH